MPCFCNGLDVECTSSNFYYNKLESSFEIEIDEWFLTDRYTHLKENLELKDNGIEFTRFDEFLNKDLYLLVPDKYKGNKVSIILKIQSHFHSNNIKFLF